MSEKHAPPEAKRPVSPEGAVTQTEERLKFVPSPDGVAQIYTNYVDVSWTQFDVRVRLAQVIPWPPTDPAGKGWVAEERAAVTFAWPHAKLIASILNEVVKTYEGINGEILVPALPSARQPQT